MSFTAITITGSWEDAAGNPATGSVTFKLTESMQDATSGEIVSPSTITAELESGAISQSLLANDDSTTTPTGAQYSVTETIGGTVRPSYLITVPHAAPGATATLASLA